MNRVDITKLLPILFFCYAFSEVLSSSALNSIPFILSIKPIFMVLIVLICSVEVFQQKYPLKYFCIGLFIIMATLINAYVSSTLIILLNVMSVFALSFNIKKINGVINSLGIGIITGVIFVLILFIFKLIPDITVWQHEKWRHSLGFSWPVVLPNFYTAFSILVILKRKEKLTLSLLAVLVIPSYFIMRFTDGRSSFYSLVIVVIIASILNIFKINKEKLSSLLSIAAKLNMTIGILFTIYIAESFQTSPMLRELNSIVTGRFSWFYTAWEQYPVNLFGNNIFFSGEESIMLDNLYLTVLLRGGIVIFFVFLFAIFSMIKFFRDNNDCLSLVILNVILANSIISASWLPIWKNILFFSIAIIIHKKFVKYESSEQVINIIHGE